MADPAQTTGPDQVLRNTTAEEVAVAEAVPEPKSSLGCPGTRGPGPALEVAAVALFHARRFAVPSLTTIAVVKEGQLLQKKVKLKKGVRPGGHLV